MEFIDTNSSPEYALQCIKWCIENQESKALEEHLKIHKRHLKAELISLLFDVFAKGKVQCMKLMLSEMDQDIRIANRQEDNVYLLHKLLCSAVKIGDNDIVKDLIDKGANVNGLFNGKPILHLAASNGFTDVAAYLVKAGADIHSVDKRGDNVIHSIISSKLTNKADTIRRVVTLGANPLVKSSAGRLPIHLAAKDAPEVLVELIRDGLDVNVPDDINSDTPLHIACSAACRETILTLIQSGSRFNAENLKGLTPLAKLLQFTHNDHDFHTKTRLSIAKELTSIGFRMCHPRRKQTSHSSCSRRDKSYDRYHAIKLSLKSPPCLQSIARLTIRESLTHGKYVQKEIDNLELPFHLKSFIMFKDMRF